MAVLAALAFSFIFGKNFQSYYSERHFLERYFLELLILNDAM